MSPTLGISPVTEKQTNKKQGVSVLQSGQGQDKDGLRWPLDSIYNLWSPTVNDNIFNK